MNWVQGLDAAQYIGYPDSTYNEETGAIFYPILRMPEKVDTSNTHRQLGLRLTYWQYERTSSVSVEWSHRDVGAGGWAADTTIDEWLTAGTDGVSYGDRSAKSDNYVDGLTYPPEASGTNDGCRQCRLKVTNAMVANMHLFHAPEDHLTDAQAILAPANCGIGTVIQGYSADEGLSIGAPIHRIGDGTLMDGIEACTRRTLFQTCWPNGVVVENETPAVNFRNNWKYRVKCRNPHGTSGGVVKCLPAMVLTADADCVVTWTADNGDSWTYTVPAGGVTNELVTGSDGATSDLDITEDAEDAVKIEVEADTKTARIQTVALFEGKPSEA